MLENWLGSAVFSECPDVLGIVQNLEIQQDNEVRVRRRLSPLGLL